MIVRIIFLCNFDDFCYKIALVLIKDFPSITIIKCNRHISGNLLQRIFIGILLLLKIQCFLIKFTLVAFLLLYILMCVGTDDSIFHYLLDYEINYL